MFNYFIGVIIMMFNDILKCTSSLGCGKTKTKDNFRKYPYGPRYFNICFR